MVIMCYSNYKSVYHTLASDTFNILSAFKWGPQISGFLVRGGWAGGLYCHSSLLFWI